MKLPDLSTLVQARPERSPIDIICEANTSHITRVFAVLHVKGPYMTEENAAGRNVDDPHSKAPMLSMRVCPTCWVQYLGFVNNVANELAKL
jgi:hypothetical protein